MTDILIALATAGALLLPVVVFTILTSIATVRRGEAGGAHGSLDGDPRAGIGDIAPESAAPALPARELSVIEILLLATALFGLAMLALLGVSMIGQIRHM